VEAIRQHAVGLAVDCDPNTLDTTARTSTSPSALPMDVSVAASVVVEAPHVTSTGAGHSCSTGEDSTTVAKPVRTANSVTTARTTNCMTSDTIDNATVYDTNIEVGCVADNTIACTKSSAATAHSTSSAATVHTTNHVTAGTINNEASRVVDDAIAHVMSSAATADAIIGASSSAARAHLPNVATASEADTAEVCTAGVTIRAPLTIRAAPANVDIPSDRFVPSTAPNAIATYSTAASPVLADTTIATTGTLGTLPVITLLSPL
jgi:hypothetical protein